jgi:hypothetical protein
MAGEGLKCWRHFLCTKVVANVLWQQIMVGMALHQLISPCNDQLHFTTISFTSQQSASLHNDQLHFASVSFALYQLILPCNDQFCFASLVCFTSIDFTLQRSVSDVQGDR